MIETRAPDVLTSLPPSIGPESPHAKQMVSNGLRYQEQHLHNMLMGQAITLWPESLKEFVDARQRAVGLCGDVISTAVADWIAHREER